MGYKTIMVHLELSSTNDGLLQIAGDLAARLHADVIGIAGCQPVQLAYGDTYFSGDLVVADRTEIEKELQQAEANFRTVLTARGVKAEWRSTICYQPLADFIAHEARAADLIITGPDIGGSIFDFNPACQHGRFGDGSGSSGTDRSAEGKDHESGPCCRGLEGQPRIPACHRRRLASAETGRERYRLGNRVRSRLAPRHRQLGGCDQVAETARHLRQFRRRSRERRGQQQALRTRARKGRGPDRGRCLWP